MWEYMVALTLAIPIFFLPVVLMEYASIGSVRGAIGHAWGRWVVREELATTIQTRLRSSDVVEVRHQSPRRVAIDDSEVGGGTAMTTTLTRIETPELVETPELDIQGYMLYPEEWTEEVARAIADGLVPGDLTEEHWRVIYHLREYYLRYGTPPPVSMLSRDTGLSLKYIYRLFPGGLARCACKIAGFPWLSFKQYP